MLSHLLASDQRFFVPEVVQTSAMDCGPATLKSVLEGFGIPISYGRLREACQTDVDGTSIDTMEDVAIQLGLEAEQIMMPADHLLLEEAQSMPSIVVVRLSSGLTHFVVVWQQYGGFVQVMDPATGRRWPTRQRFLNEIYVHTQPIPVADWREWAGSEGFCAPLQQRLIKVGCEDSVIEHLLHTALDDPGWYPLASLDAATRMVEALIQARGLTAGQDASNILQRFFQRTCQETPGKSTTIPPVYWSVQQPSRSSDSDIVLFRGAVLVRILGRRVADDIPESQAAAEAPLSPELQAALNETPSRPEQELFKLLRADGILVPIVLLLALFIAAGGVMIEAILFLGLLDLGQQLAIVGQKIGAVGALFAFLVALLLLEFPVNAIVLRIGRRLETRLRIAFLEKLSRLSDRYFHSRLVSDMVQRVHGLRLLRMLSSLSIDFIRISFQILFTAIGITWLNPAIAPITILATLFAIGMPFLIQPILIERDLRLRTHLGALSRFYLDSLLGLIPIRTHSGQKAVQREHEGLLVEWVHAGNDFYRAEVVTKGIESLCGLLFAVIIIFHYVVSGGEASGMLLLVYWTLNLSVMGRALASLAVQYPMQRNRFLRLLEPLNAPDEMGQPEDEQDDTKGAEKTMEQTEPMEQTPAPNVAYSRQGVAITLDNVSVQAVGHTILSNVNLHIQPGEHIAVIGPSGAGKSSLVGILLGWHRPSIGQAMVDGHMITETYVRTLRRETVWVDPSVQLWNRSLLHNIQYGNAPSEIPQQDLPIEQANLFDILEKLPDGLQTPLGESGGLVSGGEGQRVRLGRAMFRSGVRLVILDEPFRGLDRAQRRALLIRARQHWQNATLIFISHDVGETQAFDRVLVVEDGHIVEDNAPDVLAAHPDSRYLALVQAEEAIRTGIWSDTTWRRLWLENGYLKEGA